MDSSSPILSQLLERLVSNCRNFEEMPHHFDDSLIDRLIDSIQFEESSLFLVQTLMKTVDFEQDKAIPIQLVIRLVDAAVEKEAFDDDEQLLDFIQRSESLLAQRQRPHKMLSELFQLYLRHRVFGVRKPDGWIEVIRWAISAIDDESTTVFLRRRYQEFVMQLPSVDARRLLVISGVLQMFVRRTQPDSQNGFIVDAVTKILDRFATVLVPEECNTVVDAVRSASRLGENTLKLIVKLKALHQESLAIPLTPGSWHNESNRVDVLCSLLEPRTDETNPCLGTCTSNEATPESIEQLVDLLLYSPAVKLQHKTRILHRMSDKQIEEFLAQLKVEVKVDNKIRINDVTVLLKKLVPRTTLEQIAQLFEALGNRILESSQLLKELHTIYGDEVFTRPEFAEVKQRLLTHITDMIRTSAQESEWEQTDTALEIANIFTCFLPDLADLEAVGRRTFSSPSPYVLSEVLKILRDCYGGIPDEFLQHCLLKSPDPAPKLICMQYLSNPNKFDTLDISEVEEYIQSGLSDNGLQIQQEALKLVEKALTVQNFKNRLNDILIEYRNDRAVGRYVRRLLHEEYTTEDNESLAIVREMLASLQVSGNADEVRDCY